MKAFSNNGNMIEDYSPSSSANASRVANELSGTTGQKNLSVKADGKVLRVNATIPTGTKVLEVVDVSDYEYPED